MNATLRPTYQKAGVSEKPSAATDVSPHSELSAAKAALGRSAKLKTTASIDDMQLFVAVAKTKNFARAARQLGMPLSTLSRRIAGLETGFGFRLLSRTTRRVDLTEHGLEYLKGAERVVADALALNEELAYRGGKIGGLLRVCLPECAAIEDATEWFAEFVALYPDIRLQVDTAPEHADLARDDFDACICHTEVPDSFYVKRTLASFKWVLFASPDYIAKYGQPSNPEDLKNHDCICMTESRTDATVWTLYRGTEKQAVEVSGRVTTLSQRLAQEFARRSLGIAAAMPRPLQREVEDGRLVPILKDWQLDPLVVSILTPDRLLPAKTRAFVDFFSRKIKSIASQYDQV